MTASLLAGTRALACMLALGMLVIGTGCSCRRDADTGGADSGDTGSGDTGSGRATSPNTNIAGDANAPAPARPNIVIILADDLGIGDAGCYNAESKIPTPAIDGLAAGGMRLMDAHSPSGVCSPTRYGLLTGRYAWRAGLRRDVLWGHSPLMIDPDRMTIASVLHEVGYTTGAFGKWHLGLGAAPGPDYAGRLSPGPNDVGFDEFFGIPASLDMFPYLYVRDDRAVAPPTLEIAGSEHRRSMGGGFWRGGPIAPGFRHIEVLPTVTDEAVSFVERHAEVAGGKTPESSAGVAEDATGSGPPPSSERRPFFLYVPLTAPHTPWLPTEEFRGRSRAGYYGDFVTQVDASIGRILNAVDRAGIADDTLVIVTSDNGAHWPVEDVLRYDHPAHLHFRGQKADIHEGGHRVPFIARWPGRIPAGSTSHALVCLTDMLATFAAIVGVALPHDAGEDSVNVYPVLRGVPGATGRDSIANHSLHGMMSVRQGPWKLILGLGSGGFTAPRFLEARPGEPLGQLYNLAEDPSETNNLWLEQPETVARLEALFQKWSEDGRSR